MRSQSLNGQAGIPLVGMLNKLGGWRLPPQTPFLPLYGDALAACVNGKGGQ